MNDLKVVLGQVVDVLGPNGYRFVEDKFPQSDVPRWLNVEVYAGGVVYRHQTRTAVAETDAKLSFNDDGNGWKASSEINVYSVNRPATEALLILSQHVSAIARLSAAEALLREFFAGMSNETIDEIVDRLAEERDQLLSDLMASRTK
jgi:hypothetical protein